MLIITQPYRYDAATNPVPLAWIMQRMLDRQPIDDRRCGLCGKHEQIGSPLAIHTENGDYHARCLVGGRKG